ncbi:hypothetical protein [Ulvibacter antarcticus]|nr:hypothetical protein [Ulvibacter antarcticus]
MKNFIFFLVFCFSIGCLSQNNENDITGSYYMSSGNPEGGTNMIVMPNNTFVVSYFGGMRKGTWELKDNKYKFTYHVEPKFVLYGRHNTNLQDTVMVNMSVDANKELAIRFNSDSVGAFSPIFNKGANCFSYPYIYKQHETINILDAYAPNLNYYHEGEISNSPEFYSFRIKEAYNDFILVGLSSEYSRAGSFNAVYKDGIMDIENQGKVKKSIDYKDIGEEDLLYIQEYTKTEILPKLLEYGNEFFPYYENPTKADLVPFTRIDATFLSSEGIVVLDKSLFIVNCDDKD